MRRVLSFLMCLFSFWTWKDFFLCWLQSRGHPRGETLEHLPSQEKQPESEWAHFFSSIPKGQRRCSYLCFRGDSGFRIQFEGSLKKLLDGPNWKASYGEFLEAIASSKIVFHEEVTIEMWGDASCKYVEAFADALHQSSHGFKKLWFQSRRGSAIRFANCISSVLIGNNDVQHLGLDIWQLEEEMGKELVTEFISIIVEPHNLKILKSLVLDEIKIDDEGMEQLMKFFKAPLSTLENFEFYGTLSNVQLEDISGMLASSTSLKTLSIKTHLHVTHTRGCASIAIALYSNQSLESLTFTIHNSLELKALLDPFMPKTNNLQCNTTLTKLTLQGCIGGKEGIESLADMIYTNSSLLKLGLENINGLSSHNTENIENVLTILEALKTNKSLKRINLRGCKAVGGYKVLGAMMDLLLENHRIEDIKLYDTGLEDSGDADYMCLRHYQRERK